MSIVDVSGKSALMNEQNLSARDHNGRACTSSKYSLFEESPLVITKKKKINGVTNDNYLDIDLLQVTWLYEIIL